MVVEGVEYEARSNRIGSHADRTEFNGHLLGEPHDRRLRADIGRGYARCPDEPSELMFTMLPGTPGHARMARLPATSASRPSTLTSIVRSPSRRWWCPQGKLLGSVPALFTKTSRRPSFSPICADERSRPIHGPVTSTLTGIWPESIELRRYRRRLAAQLQATARQYDLKPSDVNVRLRSPIRCHQPRRSPAATGVSFICYGASLLDGLANLPSTGVSGGGAGHPVVRATSRSRRSAWGCPTAPSDGERDRVSVARQGRERVRSRSAPGPAGTASPTPHAPVGRERLEQRLHERPGILATGSVVAEHFTKPEILTKYRPLDARSSNRRKPGWFNPAAGSGRPQWSIRTRTPDGSRIGAISISWFAVDLHVGEHVQGGEIAQQRLQCHGSGSTPSSAACIVMPTTPRPRSRSSSARLMSLSTTATPLEPTVPALRGNPAGTGCRCRTPSWDRLPAHVGSRRHRTGRSVDAPCPARWRPGGTRRRAHTPKCAGIEKVVVTIDLGFVVDRHDVSFQQRARKQTPSDTFRRSERSLALRRCTPERRRFDAVRSRCMEGDGEILAKSRHVGRVFENATMRLTAWEGGLCSDQRQW